MSKNHKVPHNALSSDHLLPVPSWAEISLSAPFSLTPFTNILPTAREQVSQSKHQPAQVRFKKKNASHSHSVFAFHTQPGLVGVLIYSSKRTYMIKQTANTCNSNISTQ